MSALMASCLETGCCSFDYYSEAASSGSGPEIKSSSVTGTALCKFAEPPGAIPADKVDAYDDWAVELLSITRGVPLWTSTGSQKRWQVVVDFLIRVTPSCSICTTTAAVDFTVSETFWFLCDSSGATEVFRAQNRVGFLDQSGVICTSTGTISGGVGRDPLNYHDTVEVAASAVSGSGCPAYDASIFTMYLPIGAQVLGGCQDVTRYDFPGSSGSGAAILTLEWSLLSP
jgi:hypothetical protein